MCLFFFPFSAPFNGPMIFSRSFHLTFKILSLERTTSTPHPLTCVTYFFVGRPPLFSPPSLIHLGKSGWSPDGNGAGLWLMKWVCNIYDRCNFGRCGEVLLNRQREFFVKLEHECLLQALEWSASEGFFFKVRLHPGHREPVVVHVPNQRTNELFDALQNSGSLDKINLKPLEGEI